MSQSYRRRSSSQSAPVMLKTVNRQKKPGAKQFEKDWRHLKSICPDQDSQQRLAWLERQFAKIERGASESAQAEIDVATLLGKGGFSISFIKETKTRTADLECYLGHDRVFVEVTVIVPSEPDRGKASGVIRATIHPDEEDSSDFLKDGLIKRLLARMREKADQLSDYCAPVMLAITIVHREHRAFPNGSKNARRLALDLQQLGGVITTTLAGAPQFSGILVTLWNIQPAEIRSSIRLRNVYLGEWMPGNLGSFSQVRMLTLNPASRYPIEHEAWVALQRVL